MARFGEINAQYFDDAGDPLGSGKLYFYDSGTTTLKTTYSDINQTVANTNPVILTAAGRQPNIFFSGNAKAILTDSSDVQILVRDPVGQTASAFGDAWVATKIYDADAVVLASNGVYYRSLVAANQNNDPTSTSGYWTLLYSIEWNSGITYSEGANVTHSNILYQSIQNNNTNQNPSSSPAYWTRVGIAWVSTVTYAIHENVVGSDGVFYTSLQNSNLNNEPSVSGSHWVGTSAAAAASATAAATSATNAATSETNAGNSATAAATSETNAATSATNAGNSATAAATSETNAATSETNASNSASAAATSATNAATSETNAGNSATAAASSATAASTSESNAAASATTASTAATNAGTSETNAATSATNASNSATAAATSATNAATSESNAATSATAAATSATASATSATASAGSATNAAASLADFNTKYLGAHATAPTGTAAGQQYFNTTSDTMFVYTGSSWTEAGSAVNGTSNRVVVTATAAQTDFSISYDVGYVDVYLNGSKLQAGTDFTATNGVTVVLTSGAAAGDIVDMVAYGAFNVANVYTQTESDARFAQLSNNLSDLPSASTALTNLGVTSTAAELNILDGVTSTTAELNILDGVTSTAAELNILDGVTSTAAELNILDGVTATTAELNYTDGVTSNIQTQIDNINPSPTFTATASGALANGDTVLVNSDGTVSIVEESINPTPSFGTPAVFESATTDHIGSAYDSNAQKVVIAYRDSGNSSYGTAVVGTVSGTSISFGTPTVFESGITYYSAVAYDSNAQKIVIAYRDAGNSNYGTAVVGTVSGTSISFGSAAVFESAYSNYVAITYDANAQKVVIAYQDAANSYYGNAVVGTVSGTSISFGTIVVFESSWSDFISIGYDANAQKVVIAYRDLYNSTSGTAIVGTVSGTSISFGTAAVFESGDTNYTSTAYDANAQKIVIAYTDGGNSSRGTAVVGTVSGTSISFGTPVVYQTDPSYYNSVAYDANAQKVLIAYKENNTSHGTAIVGTVSGTAISFGSATVFESATTDYTFAVYDASAKQVVISYTDSGNSYYGTSVVFHVQSSSTNLTSENYIGISNAAYADGVTATIQIVGSVDDAQSSLTAGQQYFVQKDGSLALTADSPSVVAGTAVSSTKLIVKG